MVNYCEIIEKFFMEVSEREYDYFKTLLNKISENKKKYLCIWGTGLFARGFFKVLKDRDIEVDFFCDNNPDLWNSMIFEKKCISPQKCFSYNEEVLVLIASKHNNDIALQLKNNSRNEFLSIETFSLRYLKSMFDFLENKNKMYFVKNQMGKILNICEDEESKRICYRIIQNWFCECPQNRKWYDLYCGKLHFDNKILNLTNNETFVDCGAFSGDTIFEFLQEIKGEFKNVYAFELDDTNFIMLNETQRLWNEDISSRIYTYNIGLWSEEKNLFYESACDGSNISISGKRKVKVNSLDNILKDKQVSFIKMDIEGAEMQALIGAQKLIKKQRPKLAISIYHELEHLWEIPLFLKSLVPEYKIFIRHHSTQQDDTVCYAVL